VKHLAVDSMQKLILIDGNAIMHRAYHAIPPFRTSKGELINAVYGFASMLLNILNNEKPDYIAVSFDTKAKTFRHEEYVEYKATRTKAPDEFYEQIPRIKELVKTFEIPIYEMDGFEADDVLGTLAFQADKHDNLMTYIVTGDRDMFQLITDKLNVLSPIKGFQQSEIFTPAKVFEKYGLKPSQIADMKGLQGDHSDNIKGVNGIGPKTAKTLLEKFRNIENLYEHLDEVPENTRAKLLKDKESAFFSKRMATIILDVPMKLNLEDCKTHTYDQEKVTNYFQELEFKSLLSKLGRVDNHYNGARQKEQNSQASLF
jgi:DNA polymerase-1